jgi:hypothetical protein
MNNLQNELALDVRNLCSKGIRFPGTPEDAAAANWLSGRMSECGLDVNVQRFQLMGWKVNTPASLIVERPGKDSVKMECLPLVYSAPTLPEGVNGKLKYLGKRPLGNIKKFRVFERDNFLWNKYAVLDLSGNHLAHIISRDYPDNAPVAAWGALELPFTIPTVIISGQDGRILEAIQNDEVKVFLKVDTEFKPTINSFNVIGDVSHNEVPRPRDTILVTAHYDSQYNTIGAVDNATGVAGLLALAKRWKSIAGGRRLRFVGFGAEEIGLQGAKYYATSLKEADGLGRIAAILNLDMLGCNQPNWVHLSDDQVIINAVQKSLSELKIGEKYGSCELVCPPWPTGDQDPFYEENIPAISFTWKGSLYPYIHRPEDTIDKIDWTVVEDSFYLAEKVLTLLSKNL